MFLLSAQNNFYVILRSYLESYVKSEFRKLSLNFVFLVGLQAFKILKFICKIYFEASLQIIFRKKIIP